MSEAHRNLIRSESRRARLTKGTIKMAQSEKWVWTPNLSEKNEGRKMTPSQIAEILDVDPKTFRAWMRKQTTARAGSGNRWAITEFAAQKLIAKFADRKSGTVFTFADEVNE